MSSFSEMCYWITIAHLPRWGSEKINKLIVSILHENNETFENFFNLDIFVWKNKYSLGEKEIADLLEAKKSLPNNSFLAEDLTSQGYDIIPINSKQYSANLKANLKAKYSPPILYVKGNKQLLTEDSIAIVGSREAAEVSLNFTDNIAKRATEQFKVVVSGFAKGIDKQALDSALKYEGQSIIVLPQGIATFSSGIKKYYKQIVEGNALVLSTFHPKAAWSVGLAMARNPIIYGLAREIFVAQSSNKGGTWEGVKSGLKMGRTIFVRRPEPNEENANLDLIKLGAKPVDFNGDILPEENIETIKSNPEVEKPVNEEDPLSRIIQVLEKSDAPLTTSEIKKRLGLNITAQKVSSIIESSGKIIKVKEKPIKYTTDKSYIVKTGLNLDETKLSEMKLDSKPEEKIENVTIEILSLSFDDKKEWEFIYNNKIINAKIVDNEFLKKIKNNKISFANRDKLIVELKVIEYSANFYNYLITHVIKYISSVHEPTFDFNS